MESYSLPIILLVDDDDDDIAFFRIAMSGASPETRLVTKQTCEEGMDYLLDKSAAAPDSIFMDLRMFRVDGFKCIDHIKSIDELKDIPIIAISTAITSDDLDKLYNAGITYFITKPTTLERLQKAIHKIVTTRDILKISTRENFHMQNFD